MKGFLKLKVKFKIGDHDGYCSGNECEDRTEVQSFTFCFNLTHDFSLKNVDLEKLYDYAESLKLYSEIEFCRMQSGYCAPSRSGLQHDFEKKMKIKYSASQEEFDAEININDFYLE
jgi:hypothetical protein